MDPDPGDKKQFKYEKYRYGVFFKCKILLLLFILSRLGITFIKY